MIPLAPTTAETRTGLEGLSALRTSAGWTPLTGTGWIGITGGDRVRWLNGMTTNSVQALTPGDGAYSFFLNAQGRIQGDATIWATPERLLLETSRTQVEPLMTMLDRYVIMDDVELQDYSTGAHGLVLAGPGALDALGAVRLPARTSRLLKRASVSWGAHRVDVVNAYGPVVPRFEVWSQDADAIADLGAALNGVATPVSAESFELLRVLEAVPQFDVDIRDKDLPQETAQSRALHFSKGCYLGQEIVERIRSRGQVHRTFAQFVLTGDVPAAGTELQADGKPAGLLTTVAVEPIDGEHLALGFVRREAVERGLPLLYEGGSAAVRGLA